MKMQEHFISSASKCEHMRKYADVCAHMQTKTQTKELKLNK